MPVRFEVLVDGVPVCTAGQDGFGVLTALVSWRKLDPAKGGTAKASAAGELDFSVGGIAGVEDKHTSWKVPSIAIGDEVTIRLLPPGQFDPPDVRFG